MRELSKEVSDLTKVPEDLLYALQKNATYCIGHTVFEETMYGKLLTEIDIGIGTLFIKTEENQVKYKFIPSKSLEESVNQAVQKRSPIAIKVYEKLKEKLEATFKSFL